MKNNVKELDTNQKVRRPYIKKGWFGNRETLDENLLYLVRSNGEVEFYEGIEPGWYKVPKSKKGGSIELHPSKLKSFLYNGKRYRGWIADEEYAFALPPDSNIDPASISRLVYSLITGNKLLDEAKGISAKWKGMGSFLIMACIGIVILLAVLKGYKVI